MLAELIARLANIVLLIASVAWLTSAPDWEPLIATIVLATSMITLELREYKARKAEAEAAAERERKKARKLSSTDHALFDKYVAHFGGKGYQFLREQDMGAPFHHTSAKPFHSYLDVWKGPHFEFVDSELESAREVLHLALIEFTGMMLQYTYGEGDFYTMGLKDMETDPEEWQIRDRMNAVGHKAADAYDAFVRIGRRRIMESEA